MFRERLLGPGKLPPWHRYGVRQANEITGKIAACERCHLRHVFARNLNSFQCFHNFPERLRPVVPAHGGVDGYCLVSAGAEHLVGGLLGHPAQQCGVIIVRGVR